MGNFNTLDYHHLPAHLIPSLSTLSNAVRNAGLLLVVYFLTLSFYRLYLHPLAAIPGPFWSRLSSLPTVYHAWCGDRHLYLSAAHAKYGPVVRFGPNSLSFNSATALHTIYGHTHSTAFQKSAFYAAFPAVPGVWNTHNAIPKALHARKRRVLSAAFSTKALSNMAPLITPNVKILMSQLAEGAKVGIDAGEKLSAFTFDVMGTLCFGTPFNLLTSPKHSYLPPLIDRAAHLHSITGSHPLLTKWKTLPRLLFPQLSADRWKFIAHSRACADERMKQPADAQPDFFCHLLHATDPESGEGFGKIELWGEANVLMIAGSDTTGTAGSAAVWFLARHPEALKRLRAEVKGSFKSEEEIVEGPELGSCKFLKACIDEALRLAPPVPGLLPREVAAPEGTQIDGVHVPQGTVVGAPIWALHRNPEYYEQPEEFLPERWLNKDEMDPVHRAFTPFSIGSRGCIGKGVAYLELRLVLARMAWRWGRWEPQVQGETEFPLEDHFTARKKPVRVRFSE